MIDIPDDPIIRCMERTGYPPWMQAWDDEDEEDNEEEEEYEDEEEDDSAETVRSQIPPLCGGEEPNPAWPSSG